MEKLKNKAQAISVPEKKQLVKIPLIGVIAAGKPIEAIQQNEYIIVAKTKLPANGDFCALRVSGNSMIDENIKDGDVALVKQQEVMENGQWQIVFIDEYNRNAEFIRHKKIKLKPILDKKMSMRRRRDLNSRYLLRYAAFPRRCHKPLGDPSK